MDYSQAVEYIEYLEKQNAELKNKLELRQDEADGLRIKNEVLKKRVVWILKENI